MTSVKKRYRTKNVYKMALVTILLLILCISLSYFIVTTDLLKPRLSELTTSYISFNNSNATDMIKIATLEKMNDSKGISNKNKSTAEFKITGKKKTKYKVVLYHLGNSVEDEYVKFYIEDAGKKVVEDTLSNMQETNDDGRIVYEGEIKDQRKFTIKMWIDKSYSKMPNNISYELKIKS